MLRYILKKQEQRPNILIIKSNNICCEIDAWLVKPIIDAFELWRRDYEGRCIKF